MSKIKVCYIGPKDFKRDTITGSRQTFPRDTPIEVTEEQAANLLRFNKVFVEESELESVQKAREKALADAEAQAEMLQAKAEAEAKEADHTVTVGGVEYDLLKMSVSKIHTLLEGNDIDIEPKGAQEPANDFKRRVRDTLREAE